MTGRSPRATRSPARKLCRDGAGDIGARCRTHGRDHRFAAGFARDFQTPVTEDLRVPLAPEPGKLILPRRPLETRVSSLADRTHAPSSREPVVPPATLRQRVGSLNTARSNNYQ